MILKFRSFRHLGVITALTVFATVHIGAQDAHPDRFGLGVAGIAGSFGGYDAVFPGVEGFVRVARGSFWSARVDGAYYGGHGLGANVCLVSGGNGGCDDGRYIGGLGTLIATLTLGPTAGSGLRPFYGLLGVGGVATRWGGGSCSPPARSCPSAVSSASGAGPSLALIEAGVGSEFRALGGNRVELRIHRASSSLPTGNHSELGAVGASLTIGVVW
jgi:hypothetical protein